ncbi:hypothetical protein [Oscillatoria sp. FACHB-1406]|uniref:hypothetical protein n=1 Tax=Oscillatoria sp. FACHB-1406 TaxID=2692846 RepID=UPI001682F4D6|nr:hypothetical protein [Oscillatoria sp. FACHB-1406]MBD2578712.1 hypothetical protein [Oscillatoria sp. FACHB-1406]
MTVYNNVLSQVKNLTFSDKLRLLEELKTLVNISREAEEDSETLTTEELAASEAAWQDYLAGRDRGISSQELKQRLFGEKRG